MTGEPTQEPTFFRRLLFLYCKFSCDDHIINAKLQMNRFRNLRLVSCVDWSRVTSHSAQRAQNVPR
jgi:hypothetical protein